ncbi:MAG TPA: hypothetical protein VIK06_05325 [Candidatus Limnocylindrales bacterium]|jgi:hypothetical protein
MTAFPPPPRGAPLEDGAGAIWILVPAAIFAIAGIFWFPFWFVTGELLWTWAPRGGLKWLGSLGVEEYKDERYAQVIVWTCCGLILARFALALDYSTLLQGATLHVTQSPPGEFDAWLAIVLGLALAAALAGVMKTTGWPRIFALLGVVGVFALAWTGANGIGWLANAFIALPVPILGWCTARIAISLDHWLNRRAARKLARLES